MEGFPASEAAKIIGRTVTNAEYPANDARVSKRNLHSFEIIVSPDVGSDKTAFHTLGSRYFHYYDPKYNENHHWLIPHKYWSKFELDGTFRGSKDDLLDIGTSFVLRPIYMCAVFNTNLNLSIGVASLWNAVILDPETWERDAFIDFFKKQFGVEEIVVQPDNGNLWIYPEQGELHTNPMFNDLVKMLFVAGQLISEMSKKTISEVHGDLLAGYLACHCSLYTLLSPKKTVLSDGQSLQAMTVPPYVIWNEITRRIQEMDEFVALLKQLIELKGRQSAFQQLLNKVDSQKFPMETIFVNSLEDMITMMQYKMREYQLDNQGGPDDLCDE